MLNHTVAGTRTEPSLLDMAAQADAQLLSTVRAELGALFDHFVGATQAELASSHGSALAANGSPKNKELARSLKQQAHDWQRSFMAQLEARLCAADADLDFQATPGNDRVSAGLMAMAKALLLAETQYFKLITEIDARLNRIRLILALHFDARVLGPTGLHQVLERSADEMGWSVANRRVLMNNFERHFVVGLEPLYLKLLAELKEIGSKAATWIVDHQSVQPETAERKPARPSNWMQPPSDKHAVDSDTTAMLTHLALSNDGDGYTDGLLAADLLALMDRRPLPGLTQEQGQISVQKTGLAGHFLNQVKADPMVPQAQDAQHETLRMPLVKSALADSSVFTDATHPLASLIDEHMTRAARQRLIDPAQADQMSESLNEILSLFDLAPDFVRDSMASAVPLEDGQIARFYELQREQAAQRREFVISEAKLMVAEEVERSTFCRSVPAPARRFLSHTWGALLTQRLLKYGAAHGLWRDGIDKMDQLVDLLEARDPGQRPPKEWVALIRSMLGDLVQAGLPSEKRGQLIAVLEAARKTP